MSSVVSGGGSNTSTGDTSAVGGGTSNVAIGVSSAIPGGVSNTAVGVGSLACGRSATSGFDGTFVFGDGSGAAGATAANQFVIGASADPSILLPFGTVSAVPGGGITGSLRISIGGVILKIATYADT